jgi:undecaprenyl-diphosphatase
MSAATAVSWFDIIVLSIVEGITEFLPVSSTGHMILARSLMGLPDSEALDAFLIIVQSGAILAVVSVFWKLFVKWIKAWIQFFSRGRNPATLVLGDEQTAVNVVAAEGPALRAQSIAVVLSVLPFALVGFLAKDFVKSLFSAQVVAWALIVGGVFILVAERMLARRSSERPTKEFGLRDALVVGVGQCLALWPGFSRSAATLLFARYAGFSRSSAAEISFLVGLPTLLGVAGYEALKAWQHLDAQWWGYLAVGILVSWIVAYVCVKSFVAFLRRYPLSVFAWYRIAVGVGILWYFGMGSP